MPERQISENWIGNVLNEYLNLRDEFPFELLLWNVSSAGKPELFSVRVKCIIISLVQGVCLCSHVSLYITQCLPSFIKPLVTLFKLDWNQGCWGSGPFLLLCSDAGIPLKTRCTQSWLPAHCMAAIWWMQDTMTVIVRYQLLRHTNTTQQFKSPWFTEQLEFYQGERKSTERGENSR